MLPCSPASLHLRLERLQRQHVDSDSVLQGQSVGDAHLQTGARLTFSTVRKELIRPTLFPSKTSACCCISSAAVLTRVSVWSTAVTR